MIGLFAGFLKNFYAKLGNSNETSVGKVPLNSSPQGLVDAHEFQMAY